MKTTTLGMCAAMAAAAIVSASSVSAQDVSWGCAFDRHSGITVCQIGEGNPPRPTGEFAVSKPNEGIAGTYYRDDGKAVVKVYKRGRNLGREPFHWQE